MILASDPVSLICSDKREDITKHLEKTKVSKKSPISLNSETLGGSLFKLTGEALSGIKLSSSSSKQVMLGVHMPAMESWDLSVVFKVCAPSVVTHECLTELCSEF